MKKQFLVLTMVLLGLFVGVRCMRADIISDIVNQMGSMTEDDYYYMQLQASPSPAASGQVKLTWIDMMGETINEPAEKFTPLNPGASGSDNPTAYGATARLAAMTILYGEMEAPLGSDHIYVTSFTYFKAEAQPADGWYFDGWSYLDNGQILQLDTLRSGENVKWPTDPRDPNEQNATIFKIKPHNQKGTKYLDPDQVSEAAYDSAFRYVKANFKPVLLTGYRGGKSEIVVGDASVTFDVYVNIEAKKPIITVSDFNIPALGDAKFALAGMEGNVDGETGIPYAKVSVTFTAPDGMTAGTLYKTTMTASSKGGSTIVIPLEVRVVAAERSEATLYNADKTVATYGDLLGEDGVLAAITGTDQTLQLNKNYASALTLSGKTVTLNLNGYTVSSLTIDGGTVTVGYSKYDNEASGALNVAAGKAILNGGIFASLEISDGAMVEQNGATINGAVTNGGTLKISEGTIKGGITSSGALVVNGGGTIKGATAISVTGGAAQLARGTITGTAYGVQTTGGATTIEKLAVINGETKSVKADGGTVTINNGKFGNALSGTLTLNSGYFKSQTIGVDIPEGKNLMNVAAGTEYEEGYLYFVGNAADALASNVGVCRIGSTSYARLEDAIAYANNNPSEAGLIILMTNDYVLPAGYYTLPSNATIIIPKDDSQDNSNSVVRRTVLAYSQPSEFRRLTFAAGVNMEVFGAIEVSCMQHAYDTGNGGYNSNPWGPYGHLVLEEGTKVTLQNGAHIYAWGFITGKGEIDARRGSTVHEQFQMGDWKGGTTSFGMLSDSRGVFPVTQYWIQNVEAPAKFHPGSILAASAAVSVLSGMVVAYANDINIVGVNGRDDAMFLLDNEADADNTWIRKWYDVENDMQVYEVNNTAHIGSLVLKLGKLADLDLNMNSATFKLPITNNMKIHLLSGFMDFTQDAYLLPGSIVEVDKKSVVSITTNEDPSVHSGSLYVYAADDWGDYIIDKTGGLKFTKAVPYEPITDGRPNVHPGKKADGQTDATILVHGQFDTSDGYIYTSNGGANICSTNEDAGTFTFTIEAKAADYTEEVYHASGTSIDGTPDIFSPAKLRNAEGAEPQYAETAGTPEGKSYCYMDGRWVLLTIDPHHSEFMRDNYDGFYAKPSEYVEIVATKDPTTHVISGNEDHTFSDAAGAGRLFILLKTEEGYAQWWEVEKKDNLYHCIHPNNDTYYYWSGSKWLEKRFTISWKNWDGTILQTIGPDEELVNEYEVTYGTQAEYLGTNPTRAANIDYTYDFTGWSPTPGKVTSDVTYTATYTEKPRMYTIIFQQEGGVEIERHFLKHNEVPVCENVPTKVGHILQWSPAIAAVTGDATYTATWLEEPPTEYEVTFYDYDGTTKLKPTGENPYMVAVGAMPEAPANPSGKPATSEFTYVFDHWSPTVVKVTEAATYTAVYREEAKTYRITFLNEDNSEIEHHDYTYGATPVCADLPTKAATAQYTYKLRWTPQIQTVMADATYKAVFDATLNKYTVSVKSNPSGACAITGGGIYDYDGNGSDANKITITVTPNAGYTPDKWNDNVEFGPLTDGKYTRVLETLTGDINLVANFTLAIPDYIITWKNEDGSANLVDPVGQKEGTATTYTGAIPTKPATAGYTYTFDGWATEANGERVYRNGMTPKATANATYYAHFAAEAILSLEISNGVTVLSEPVEYQNLIITSDGVNSGQLLGIENLTLTGDAYFDYKVNMKTHTWYAVAVPWEVNLADGGVILNGQALHVTADYDVIYYNGALRADVGPQKTWTYETSTMHPGTLYLIALQGSAPSGLRFKAKSHNVADLNKKSTKVYQYPEATDNEGKDAGWNGVANPAIFQAFVNAGATIGQAFNSETGGYDVVLLNSTKMVVGQGVFVQVPASANVTVAYGASYDANEPVALAPRRATNESVEANYEVRIAPVNSDFTDRLFVQMNDEKEEDVYTVGKDLMKMGVSNQKAQMWINRYNTRLCLNTMKAVECSAEYPLGIFVPEAGDYTIGIKHESGQEETTIYLTYDGEAIWNLSRNAYVLELEPGTTSHYGLRVSAHAPQITTSVDEAIVESKETNTTAVKVLIGNQVYIIRGGEVYTITGLKIQ